MNIYTTTIFLSIIAYVFVGNFVGRKVKGLEDYFVVSRQAPVLLISGTLVASFLSTGTYMGWAGLVYEFNVGWLVLPSLVLAGYIYGSLYFGRYLRRSRCLTVAEYFAKRFDSRRLQVIAGITVMIGISVYLIAVSQALALILANLTSLSYAQGLIVVWLSYTSFTFYSGSKGIVITDTMMFLLFTVVTFLGMMAIFGEHGGWVVAMEKLVSLDGKENLMAWHGRAGPGQEFESPSEFLIWFLIGGVAMSLVTAISPWQSSRYLMAKDEHVVLRSACVAAISIGVLQAMVQAAVGVVNLSNSAIEPRDEVLVWAALNMMPPMIGALLLSGIVAAALSSASTFLSLIGFNLSHDIFSKETGDERDKLKFSRLMMLVASLLVLFVCLLIEPSIWWLTFFAATMFASAWGPVALMSIGSSRVTESAAFWGIISGFLGNIIPKLLTVLDLIELPVYLDPILLGAFVSLAVVLIMMSKTTVTGKGERYRQAILRIPEEDIDNQAVKKSLVYAYTLGVFGILMTVLMIVFYVIPYQKALSSSSQKFQFDWLSGEAIGSYSWSIIFLFLSTLLVRRIRQDYSID